MNFEQSELFQKDVKRLSRKYKSLTGDLQTFCSVAAQHPRGNSKHFHTIARGESCDIVKARLFCRYLKGSSLRIVYAYFEAEQRVEFIELYFKGTQKNEDRRRIQAYLGG